MCTLGGGEWRGDGGGDTLHIIHRHTIRTTSFGLQEVTLDIVFFHLKMTLKLSLTDWLTDKFPLFRFMRPEPVLPWKGRQGGRLVECAQVRTNLAPHCPATWPPDYLTTWPPDYLTIWLLDHLTTWPIDHPTFVPTWTPAYFITWPLDHLTALPPN